MQVRIAIALSLALGVMLTACGTLPSATPQGQSRVTFLPGAPKPGDLGYDETACGGDHGMAEQWSDDMSGYPRPGPPQMSICP